MAKTIVHQLKTDENSLCGMSYVIQCSDGSLVVIDGSVQENRDSLYFYLRDLCGGKDPVVDAWFFTHAHPDHTYCAKAIGEAYGDHVKVKKLIYRFPDEDFLRLREPDCLEQIPAFERAVSAFGAEHVLPKRGDRFVFGDTVFEILLTCLDLPSLKEENIQVLNDTSLVFRVHAEGQTVLFLGDIGEAADRVLMKLYGKELKSDICQVAHHGYYASAASFYDLVDPEILLWPCAARELDSNIKNAQASRHLATEMNVKDIYVHGHGTVALELPLKVREQPFMPVVEPLPVLEDKEEYYFDGADAIPDISDPYSKTWDQTPWRPIGNEETPVVFWKPMWKENKLYFNVRVDRPYHPYPNRISSGGCDSVRFYVTDRPVTNRTVVWMDLKGKPGCFANIKLYAEEKDYLGERFCNMGADGHCESSYLVEKDRYYVTAAVDMGRVYQKGERIGINCEISGVNEEGRKDFSAMLAKDTHDCFYAFYAAALTYTTLR